VDPLIPSLIKRETDPSLFKREVRRDLILSFFKGELEKIFFV
jgi:hypothetical protein